MNKYKDLQEAVLAAKNGDKDAYGYLYEKSYREKYAIALRYMRNPADAEDVVSEAYTIAWERIATLENPDRFSAWLGRIVAHTAINSLKKKKPLPFSSVGSEDEEFFPDIEDETIEGQPELSYTTKERSEIIESMLDALSEEQRVCVVMYYMEGMSTPEIAELLDCPVSTVKSRLKYAKDNLHKQAEILQKNGYNFYGVAPVPLFVYLLKSETAGSGAVLGAAGVGVAASATLGKVVALIGGAMVIGGLTVGTVFMLSPGHENDAGTETPVSAGTETVAPTDRLPEKTEVQISDTDLPDLISGGHTKRDLELLLLYAPVEMSVSLSEQEISDIIRGALLESDDEIPPMIHKLSPDYEPFRSKTLEASTVNRFISAITDYRLEGKETTLPDLPVIGEDVFISGVNVDPQKVERKTVMWKKCEITDITQKKDEILIEYTRSGRLRVVENGNYTEGRKMVRKQVALLKRLKDGSFRIARIGGEDESF